MGTASNQINLSQDFSSPHSQHNPIFFHTKTSPPSSLGSSGPTAAADCTSCSSIICVLTATSAPIPSDFQIRGVSSKKSEHLSKGFLCYKSINITCLFRKQRGGGQNCQKNVLVQDPPYSCFWNLASWSHVLELFSRWCAFAELLHIVGKTGLLSCSEYRK